MSGFFMPAGKNIVTLYIDGQAYSHWTILSFTMELNSCARSFSFGATPKLPGNTSLNDFRPGQKVQIAIGDDLVLSGYIDATPVSYSASSVSLTVSGRSKTCDLVDCSVYPKDQNIAVDQRWSGAGVHRIPSSGSVVSCPDVSAISWRGQQLGTILAQLVKPYGVKLINQGQELSKNAEL